MKRLIVVFFLFISVSISFADRFTLDYDQGDWGLRVETGFVAVEDLGDLTGFNYEMLMGGVIGSYWLTDELSLNLRVPYASVATKDALRALFKGLGEDTVKNNFTDMDIGILYELELQEETLFTDFNLTITAPTADKDDFGNEVYRFLVGTSLRYEAEKFVCIIGADLEFGEVPDSGYDQNSLLGLMARIGFRFTPEMALMAEYSTSEDHDETVDDSSQAGIVFAYRSSESAMIEIGYMMGLNDDTPDAMYMAAITFKF